MISSRDIECRKWAQFFGLSMKNDIFSSFNISKWNHPVWLKLSGRFTGCETCLCTTFQITIPSFDFSANTWPEVENSVKQS